MLTNILTALFVLFLVAAVPLLSYGTASPSRIRLIPRSALYVSAVLSQLLLIAVGAVVAWATRVTPSRTGLHPLSPATFLNWTVGLTLVSFAGIGLIALLEHAGWWPQESEINRLLLPETTREKLLALLLVAPSAGFCEELLYRGYLLPQLSRWFSSTGWGWVGSSLAFGLAHSYQGVSGALQAALLGALLAYPMVKTGSVYPSMAAHFLIDAILLVWLGRKLLGPTDNLEPKLVSDEKALAAGPDTIDDAGKNHGTVNGNDEPGG